MIPIAPAADLLLRLVGAIGDAKEWRLEIRKWAYLRADKSPVNAEALEAWALAPSGPFSGRRREALRMWAYDNCPNGHLEQAEALYAWVLKAEDTRDPAAQVSPGKSFGDPR